MRPRHLTAFRWAAPMIIAAAVLYCSWPLGFLLNPSAMRSGLASELGAYGQPYNWLFIGGDVLSGALLLIGATMLLMGFRFRGAARWALILLAIYGLCGALDAALPMSCLPSEHVCGPVLRDPVLIGHGVFDMGGALSLLGTLIATAMHVHRHNRQWWPWIYVIGTGGILFALLSGAFFVFGGPGYWAQRYYITLSCIWVASLPFVLRPKDHHTAAHTAVG